MFTFAVLSFPGTNCEEETLRAFRRAGMKAEKVLWNDEGLLSGKRCAEFDGYALAGGFSYEDRGRSGVVAAQDPVAQVLKNEADKGKVVLGICNGAQILVETGLVPGLPGHALGMALSWNEMKQSGHTVGTGYYNVWCHLRAVAPIGRSPFSHVPGLLHVPVAHGEGRFVIEPALLAELEKNDQILFKYCDAQGRISPDFPITPNGSVAAVAAVCNTAGNVMAMMPHPERDPLGSGQEIFHSIRRFLEARALAQSGSPASPDSGRPASPDSGRPAYHTLSERPEPPSVEPLPAFDALLLTRLIITDNAERTVEETLRRKGIDVTLERFECFGFMLKDPKKAEEAVARLVESGELANANKHRVYAKNPRGFFEYHKGEGLKPSAFALGPFVVAGERTDTAGEDKKEALDRHAPGLLEEVHHGVLWHFPHADAQTQKRVVESHLLHNPYSMVLYA